MIFTIFNILNLYQEQIQGLITGKNTQISFLAMEPGSVFESSYSPEAADDAGITRRLQ